MNLRDDGSIGLHVGIDPYDSGGVKYRTVIFHTLVGTFQSKVRCDDIDELLRKVAGNVAIKEEDTDPREHNVFLGQVLEDDEPQEDA